MNRHLIRGAALAAMLASGMFAGASNILIDLEFRPSMQTVNVGQQVEIGIYAVADSSVSAHFNSVQAILSWDPSFLQLTGTDLAGTVGLAVSDFTAGDSWGLNESNPPADGDGMWFGFAPITFPPTQLPATPAGSLLTTLEFTALAETPSTMLFGIDTIQKPGRPQAFTEIYDQTFNVFGEYRNAAKVEIVPEPAALLLLALGGLLIRRR